MQDRSNLFIKLFKIYLFLMFLGALFNILIYFNNFSEQGNRFTSFYEQSLYVSSFSSISIFLGILQWVILLLGVIFLFVAYKYKWKKIVYFVPLYHLLWNLCWWIILPLLISLIVFHLTNGLVLYENIFNILYDFEIFIYFGQLVLVLIVFFKLINNLFKWLKSKGGKKWINETYIKS
mgnify:CR=1 FL=1